MRSFQVKVTQEQKRRLKQIHWEAFKDSPEGSVWQRDKPRTDFDLDQAAHLFRVNHDYTLGTSVCNPTEISMSTLRDGSLSKLQAEGKAILLFEEMSESEQGQDFCRWSRTSSPETWQRRRQGWSPSVTYSEPTLSALPWQAYGGRTRTSRSALLFQKPLYLSPNAHFLLGRPQGCLLAAKQMLQ